LTVFPSGSASEGKKFNFSMPWVGFAQDQCIETNSAKAPFLTQSFGLPDLYQPRNPSF